MVLTDRRRRRRPAELSPTPALDAAAAAAAAVAAAEAAARRPPGQAAEPRATPDAAPRRAEPVARRAGGRPRASWIFPIRIALVAVIGLMLAVLGGRAFDEFVPALLVPPPVVALVAYTVRRRPVTVRVAAEFVITVVTGLLAGVIAGGALDELLGDAIDGPRRLVTTEWPSPLDTGVVITIALAVALTTAIAADLAGRARFHLAPLAPVSLAFAGVMAIAAPVAPVRWTLVVLAVAAVTLLLARPGDDPRTRLRLLANERSLLATLGGLVAAVVVASTAIAWSDRADPRQDVEAEVTLAVLDPVEQMAALRAIDPPIPLFGITDRSTLIGPTLPARWRTSALSEYDGQRWLPALTLRPIGGTLGEALPTQPDIAPPIEFDLQVRTDDIDLIPLPGQPLRVDAGDLGIETDAERTVVRLAEVPTADLLIRVESEVAPTAEAADDTLIATRQVDEIANSFLANAEEIGGDGTILERLRTIESTMRGWDLDEDAPGAGQQLTLIDRFVTETNRGTRAQFVTAYVLLARSMGVDARVATGFLVPPEDLKSPLTLRSSSATVWAEVRLTGLGWMVFDPVPPEDAPADDEEPPPPSAQSPAAAQPPADPPPDRDETTETPEPDTELEAGASGLGVWAVRGIVAGSAVVVPIASLVGLIVFAKWRRRRRRLRAADPAQRIVGAWANATDSMVDAGLMIGPSWTDERIAEHAAGELAGIPAEVHRLAIAATAMTFGAPRAADADAAIAVAHWQSVEHAIRHEQSRLQRLRWRLSTRSLRRRTKSPVIA